MKNIFLCLIMSFSFSYSATSGCGSPVFPNDAFNYFFSIPMWILILSVPMLLAFSAFKHLK